MTFVSGTHPLDIETTFPNIEVNVLDQGSQTLPGLFGERWGVVLFYRGVWCGYCRRQLVDFEANREALAGKNATILAASVDHEQDARKMQRDQKITFPIGFGLDVLEVARLTGCFYEKIDMYLQKCAFVLRPGGEIARAVYSAGPVGALTAADVLYSLEFYQKNPHHRAGKLRPATV